MNYELLTRTSKMENGFTLLELIIVMSILIVMIGGAMYVIFSGQEAFDEGSITSFLESQAARLIDAVKDDIAECLVITGTSVPTTSNNYASLTIKVPVLVSGAYWNTATGAVNWGAYDSSGNPQPNWYIKYSFSYTKTLSEAADGLDYNKDGDLTDSFDIGEMVKDVYNTTDVLQYSVKLCNDIMTVATNRYLDVDGNGDNDPIFVYCDKDGESVTSNGIGVILNFWLGGKLGAKRNPILVNTSTAIMLINPQ
ncbi:MAG: type II secretion system protein [Planctomycetota bacterium]